MKTLTNFLIVVDFFFIMALAVVQIGCMTKINAHDENINSNVIVAPDVSPTNTISNQTGGGSSFNNEHYIWENWDVK